MFSFFRQSFRQWARSGTRTAGAPKTPARRLHCETLEDRIMPSLPGSEVLVNTIRLHPDQQAAAASSTNGLSVVVWTDVKPGYDRDIKAQRFDAYGHKVGGEILIAGGRAPQHNASVAMDAHGNFAVTWTQDYSLTDSDIHAAVFRADGTRIGNELVVASLPKNEYDPTIAMAANGDFVVTYTYQFGKTDSDIKAVLFHADGSIARTIDVAISSRAESNASVTMSPDGRFAVSFVKADDIWVQRYTKEGNLIGTHVVAGGANPQREPDVSMDSHGNTVVVWQENVNNNWGIYARAISSTGQVGAVHIVQATTAQETLPTVAVDPTTSKFVVAYQSQTGSVKSVKVTELSAAGAQIRTSTMDVGLANPSVSIGGSAHRYLVAGESIGSKGGDFDGGVFARFGIL